MIPVIVVLLIMGLVLILASFIFKDSLSKDSKGNIMTEEEIERLVERRFSEVKYRLDDEAEKSADIIKDQTERELEKLSNEKIMAVNEYSDQVMNQINKNHNEVMFLYSMLSDKQKELDYAVEKLSRMKKQTEDEEKLAKNRKKEADTTPQAQVKTETTQVKKEKVSKAHPNGRKDVSSERYANKEKILQLYQDGKNSVEIAKQLNLGVGEVRLVLELSKGRQA